GAEEVQRHQEAGGVAVSRPIVLTARGVFADQSSSESAGASIQLRQGEALGFASAAGAGAIACAETIAGFRPSKRGLVETGGRRIQGGRPDKAIAAGVAMVAANRHAAGVLPNLTVRRNISISALDQLTEAGLVSDTA